MKVTILGSGTSHGVPMIGCECAVCKSPNPKNRRFRPSITVENEGRTILVDTTPELRLQALAVGLNRVDAVLYTHTHADHLFGLDDLRRFNDLSGEEIPIYGDEGTLEDIRRAYRYIFVETQEGGGKPRISLNVVPERFELFGLEIQSFYVMHGRLPVLAYRFDYKSQSYTHTPTLPHSFAYVTDTNHIPPDSMEKLRGLDLLILDAVRPKPHVTHFGLYEALEVIEELKPKQALLTHLSHLFDHDETNAELPGNVRLAYDGQVIDL
jgi:phosphoribosyl 1,2-cyclic phosphate phosphodiesterase